MDASFEFIVLLFLVGFWVELGLALELIMLIQPGWCGKVWMRQYGRKGEKAE